MAFTIHTRRYSTGAPRSQRPIARSIPRVSPLSALRLTFALPSGVRGPVDRSHGFQFLISTAPRARRSGVQLFCQCLSYGHNRSVSVNPQVGRNRPLAIASKYRFTPVEQRCFTSSTISRRTADNGVPFVAKIPPLRSTLCNRSRPHLRANRSNL